jgi:hypothetical protein
MSHEYKIRTVTDFLQVPSSRLDECLKDLPLFLNMLRNARDIESTFNNLFSLPEGATKIDDGCFHWVDDGKRELSGFEITTLDGESIQIDANGIKP